MDKNIDDAPGLYVHIPFCLSRCSYCAFATGSYDSELVDRYLNALSLELSALNIFAGGTGPATLFIGGGTPNSLSPAQLDNLLSFLPFPDANGEATCECNPDSASREKLSLLRQAGITRCSFGAQTFSESGLRLLERRHDAITAKKWIAAALEMGMPSVGVDLISGWPGQSARELLDDLHCACELGVSHISCYNLMIEDESRFREVMKKNALSEKNEDEMRRFWDLTDSCLEENGYIHYETSNFARRGFACRHNVDIWKGKEYLGIGAAAHSHMGGRRFANHSETTAYIEMMEKTGSAEVFSEQLEPHDKARETAVFWLRLFDGIECTEFRRRTGFDLPALYSREIPELLNQRVLCIERNAAGDETFKIRRDLHPVLDSILVDLV